MAEPMETSTSNKEGDAKPAELEELMEGTDPFDDLPEYVRTSNASSVKMHTRTLENETKYMKGDVNRLKYMITKETEEIKSNKEKIKLNKQLPYLVGTVVEILTPEQLRGEEKPKSKGKKKEEEDAKDKKEGDAIADTESVEAALQAAVDKEESAEDGGHMDLDDNREEMAVVIKTSTRQTVFLPVVGLVDPADLRPGDLIGVNKDSYLILDTLPVEYDARVKAMEVDEKPTENYSDVGGLDKQIQELIEAIVLPITHKERFERLGIKPPKGVLMYGPPGTGKTLLARACAAQTNSCFLKLAGPQLVQMFIGDGAKLVRDAFELAKEKAPTIIFIDELDAIGTKRFDSDKSGDREVQRTMLELLNQLDGFTASDDVKVIAATNRIDILDPALLRSGRLDRKVEFTLPIQEGRVNILKIHSRSMQVNKDVNYEEIGKLCDDMNGAQLKAVTVEAGMAALRRESNEVLHQDFVDGVAAVQAKKKKNLAYFA